MITNNEINECFKKYDKNILLVNYMKFRKLIEDKIKKELKN